MVGNRQEVVTQLLQAFEELTTRLERLKAESESTPEHSCLGEFVEKYIAEVNAGEPVDEETFIDTNLPPELRLPAREFLVLLRLETYLMKVELQLFELRLRKIVQDYSSRMFMTPSDATAIEEELGQFFGEK